ncbi:MAG: hypothetical protein NVS1B4_04310 [Gemmatimonadaceae bacterium]
MSVVERYDPRVGKVGLRAEYALRFGASKLAAAVPFFQQHEPADDRTACHRVGTAGDSTGIWISGEALDAWRIRPDDYLTDGLTPAGNAPGHDRILPTHW